MLCINLLTHCSLLGKEFHTNFWNDFCQYLVHSPHVVLEVSAHLPTDIMDHQLTVSLSCS